MTPLPVLAAALMLVWPVKPGAALMLHVPLCNGGSANIPIDRDDGDRGGSSACHSVLCQGRKRLGSV